MLVKEIVNTVSNENIHFKVFIFFVIRSERYFRKDVSIIDYLKITRKVYEKKKINDF